jgi:hypothetical protein
MFNLSSLIEEPTTISEYFNPINNVASSVTTTDVETNVENVQLQNFEDENIQNLINILASTTTSKPRTATTKEPSANAYTTSPNIEESTLTPEEANILEMLGQPTTSEPATTTTETPTTIRITAKEQARMCLFHGICDINQIQKFAKSGKPTVSTTTTTKTTTTTTLRSTTVATATAKSPGGSGFALLAQIQRCIQTPEHCNTNLIPMKKSNAAAAEAAAASTTTARSTTTTTASTTLDPLEIARYF